METVLITGGTGLIGNHLSEKLLGKGYNVTILTRNKNSEIQIPQYSWDPENNLVDTDAILSADYIIHLAGAGIGDRRWTKRRKQVIVNSRIITGELLYNKVKETGTNLKAFISASAIGYYGSKTSEKIYSEGDPPGNDFLANVCINWEQIADKFENSGIRTVKIRTGIILAKRGSALAKIMIPVKLGIGSPLGNGQQYIPWIHIEDICNIYIWAIENTKLSGSINAVAPQHITNRDFMKLLASILRKPFFAPAVPSQVMKLMFGEMSEILLNGSRISCGKIISSGYAFAFPDLRNSFMNLISSTEPEISQV
jgi:uncharacterized protein (TIGR01777 family)